MATKLKMTIVPKLAKAPKIKILTSALSAKQEETQKSKKVYKPSVRLTAHVKRKK